MEIEDLMQGCGEKNIRKSNIKTCKEEKVNEIRKVNGEKY